MLNYQRVLLMIFKYGDGFTYERDFGWVGWHTFRWPDDARWTKRNSTGLRISGQKISQSKTGIGISWHILAYLGISWHTLAYLGISWHILAYLGISWHILAYLGMFIQVEKCYKTFMSSDSNRTDGEFLGRAWWLTLKVSSLSEMKDIINLYIMCIYIHTNTIQIQYKYNTNTIQYNIV